MLLDVPLLVTELGVCCRLKGVNLEAFGTRVIRLQGFLGDTGAKGYRLFEGYHMLRENVFSLMPPKIRSRTPAN